MSSGTESGHEERPLSAVDVGLIDEMLALSPEERLRQNDRMIRTIDLVRQGLGGTTGENGR